MNKTNTDINEGIYAINPQLGAVAILSISEETLYGATSTFVTFLPLTPGSRIQKKSLKACLDGELRLPMQPADFEEAMNTLGKTKAAHNFGTLGRFGRVVEGIQKEMLSTSFSDLFAILHSIEQHRQRLANGELPYTLVELNGQVTEKICQEIELVSGQSAKDVAEFIEKALSDKKDRTWPANWRPITANGLYKIPEEILSHYQSFLNGQTYTAEAVMPIEVVVEENIGTPQQYSPTTPTENAPISGKHTRTPIDLFLARPEINAKIPDNGLQKDIFDAALRILTPEQFKAVFVMLIAKNTPWQKSVFACSALIEMEEKQFIKHYNTGRVALIEYFNGNPEAIKALGQFILDPTEQLIDDKQETIAPLQQHIAKSGPLRNINFVARRVLPEDLYKVYAVRKLCTVNIDWKRTDEGAAQKLGLSVKALNRRYNEAVRLLEHHFDRSRHEFIAKKPGEKIKKPRQTKKAATQQSAIPWQDAIKDDAKREFIKSVQPKLVQKGFTIHVLKKLLEIDELSLDGLETHTWLYFVQAKHRRTPDELATERGLSHSEIVTIHDRTVKALCNIAKPSSKHTKPFKLLSQQSAPQKKGINVGTSVSTSDLKKIARKHFSGKECGIYCAVEFGAQSAYAVTYAMASHELSFEDVVAARDKIAKQMAEEIGMDKHPALKPSVIVAVDAKGEFNDEANTLPGTVLLIAKEHTNDGKTIIVSGLTSERRFLGIHRN